MRPVQRILLSRVAAVLCFASLALAAAAALPSVSAWAAPAAQITLVPVPIGGNQPLPFYVPRPDLVVETVSLDRGSYWIGLSWSVTVTVRNIGDAPAGSLSVAGHLCRYLQVASSLSCDSTGTDLGQTSNLQPDEAVEFTGGPFSFDSLPVDETPLYLSDGITGLPDAGVFYLEVEVIAGPGITEHDDSNNLALASAVYPSAPADPAYDPALDADADGWMAGGLLGEDCNDSNPEVNPWHNEVLGDGIDNDCSGGDVPPLSTCPTVDELYHTSNDISCDRPPGTPTAPLTGVDADGDGVHSDEDCDDNNSAIRPSSGEWADGVDNNCNGLVDEGFAIPDWAFADFQLFRGFVNPGYLIGDYTNPNPFYMPVLRYNFQIENQGESLGEGQQGVIDGLVLIQDLEGRIFAAGNGGFIPYTAFDYGGGFVPACDPVGLLAVVPAGGIYGETNAANNVAVGNTPPQVPSANVITEGPFDRDLRFSSAPAMSPDTVFHHSEAVGTCPPLMDNVTDQSLPSSYLIGYRIYVEGELVAEHVWDNGYTYSPALGDTLSGGDRVCLELRLDPNNYVFEVDEGNNSYTQLLRYRNPIIGDPHFDVIDAYSDGPSSCATGEIVAGSGAASTSSSLSSGSPSRLLGGLGGALLLGALGAAIGLYGPRRAAGVSPKVLPVASGFLIGALAGGLAGAALLSGLAPRPWQSPPSLVGPQPQAMGLENGSCDVYVDWAASTPADAAALKPDETLVIEVQMAEAPERKPIDRLVLSVHNPAGKELALPMMTAGVQGGRSSLDLVARVREMTGTGFLVPGEYQWEIGLGQWTTGDEAAPYAIGCRGSSARSFSIVAPGAPPTVPTATATPSATVTTTVFPPVITIHPPTRTSTPSATPVADTSGPSIKSVSDSDDPIKVSQPKGCTPTTSSVSAAISDPSGVQSASVLFFHTTIGRVPMSHGSGNSWSAVLGPYTGIGDGTVDYQIRATDGQGNTTDSAFGQITVLACLE